MPTLQKRTVPRWQSIKESLQEEILKASFGQTFYSLQEICRRYRVSQITARRVLAELADEDLIEKQNGRVSTIKKVPEKLTIQFVVASDFLPETFRQPCVMRTFAGVLQAAQEIGAEVDILAEKYLGMQETLEHERTGFLLMGGNVQEETRELLRTHRLPHIIFGPVGQPAVCAEADTRQGFFLATSHLLALGHRVIGGVLVSHPDSFSRRFEGYADALRNEGMEPVRDLVKKTDGFCAEEDERAFQELMDLPHPPTAILAGTDYRAIHLLEYCCRRNIRVPEEISICGYDNIAEARRCVPPLTTVDTGREKIGQQAVRLLAKMIAGPKRKCWKDILVQPELVIRKSTGAVAAMPREVETVSGRAGR